jgi:hypothetical protein
MLGHRISKKEQWLVKSVGWCGHGVVGLEGPRLRSLEIGRQHQRLLVSACKAAGYAREGLPLCDGDRMRLHGRRSARNGAGRGHGKARVQVKVSVAVGKLSTGGRGESADGRHASCGRA